MQTENKHVVELGLEFCAEFLLALYQFGHEQMELPHNYWVGLFCWILAIALAIRIFWIFPFLGRLGWLTKTIMSVLVVSALLVLEGPAIIGAYKKQFVLSKDAKKSPVMPYKFMPKPPPLEKSPLRAIRKPPLSAEEMAAALEGDLLGGDEEITDGKQRVAPWVEIADSGSVQIMIPKPGPPEPYYKPFPDAEFRTEYGKKGPMVSTTIRDAEGHIVAVVEKNHWTVYQPFCTDKNYTQDSLEILDSSWHVVLQLRILPDRVRVQGEWWDNQGHGLRVVKDSQGRAWFVALGPRMKNNELLIKPIFKHPSKHHWGEFIQ